MVVAERPGVVQYRPRGGMWHLFHTRDQVVVLEGPAGTGKTYGALWYLHSVALQFPRMRALLARKTLASLTGSAQVTFQNHILGSGVYGVEPYGGSKFAPAAYRYGNGSQIIVGGMDKASKVMSAEYDLIYIPEATELTETDAQALMTRLRNGVMPYQQLLMDCNPAGPQHWINHWCNTGRATRITTTHRDNPLLWDRDADDWTDFGRSYMEKLWALTGVMRKRLLDGTWSAAEGIVYPEFNRETHVRATVDRFRHLDTRTAAVPEATDVASWPTVLGVDVGSRNPTAILTAHVSSLDHIHIGREVYRTGMSSADIVDAIDAEAQRVDPDMIYMDPSAKSLIEDVRRLGWPVTGADNNVLVGIQRVHAAFQAGFTIDPACTNTIDEFGMYAYPENARVDLDKPAKEHDHCLVAGTMVETSTGPVPIERVRVGDYVLTRDGYRPVLASGITGIHAEVFTVHLSDGSTLTGTGNHRVWGRSRGDWIRIDALRYGDIMMGIQEAPSCVSNPSPIAASSSAAIPTPPPSVTGTTTDRAVSTSCAVSRRCIGKSGRITTDRSRTDGTSTIGTATLPITMSRIWSACRRSITSAITATSRHLSASASIWSGCDPLLLSGIALMRAGHGTAPTVGTHGSVGSRSESAATNAVSSMTTSPVVTHLDSVPTPARLRGDARPAWMTRIAPAPSVEPPSGQTSTTVPRPVPLHVVGVSRVAQRQTVYDLTVDGAHEFFANGILVHNSMDSLRYLVAGVLRETGADETTSVIDRMRYELG